MHKVLVSVSLLFIICNTFIFQANMSGRITFTIYPSNEYNPPSATAGSIVSLPGLSALDLYYILLHFLACIIRLSGC